ncbi:hypothetical protein BGX27_006621 [Mortierella sp. AM989]|nr:hypothetical protein BGX27_006621 [Mortierella sp. AM989]
MSPAGSPLSITDSTPLGTPSDELQKLSLGEERYARAIYNSAPIGSFSGTVPLPLMSQAHITAPRRRQSNALVEPLTSNEAGVTGNQDNTRDLWAARGNNDAVSDLEGTMTFSSLKRAISSIRGHDDESQMDDLESNIKQAQGIYLDTKPHEVSFNEKVEYASSNIKAADFRNIEPSEGEGQRKSKGGILSHLLKLQRNEAVASGSSPSASRHRQSPVKSQTVRKSKKGLYYRSGSRNNSTTSLKSSPSASASATPKVSPRNSLTFENEKLDNVDGNSKLRKRNIADNRTIHRDIAEILTRQSFLIMIARSLILYGAPSHRIEETCSLLAQKMEVDASFALLPGLMTISFSDPETHTSDTRHLRCSQGMDMHKLAGVHRIVLAVLKGESVEKANQELERLTLEPGLYPLWLTLLGWMGSSAFVAPLAFNGGGFDMLLAGFCGLMVGILGIVAGKVPVYGNVFEMTASILVGFVAKAFGDRVCFSAVALAGVVVLLPGLLLTQAIMELSSRNIVSGAVKMFYALMYAFFLGFGLTMGAELWDYVAGGPVAASASACQHSISRWWYFIVYPAVSASINIVFNAHPRQWFGMTSVTAVGFMVTLFFKSGPQVNAAVAAFAVGISGQLYGRLTGQLSYVALLSGILILVPGSVGVRGILAIIGNDPSQGFSFVLTMIHVSVAITLGVFCSALVCVITMSIAFRSVAGTKSGTRSLLSATIISRSGSRRVLNQSIRIPQPNALNTLSRSILPLSRTIHTAHTSPSYSTALISALSTHTRTLSTAAGGQDTKAEEEPIQGSAPSYKRHILICTGVPSKNWVKKPELADPYLNLLTTEVRGQEVKVNLTDEASTELAQSVKDTLLPTRGPRHDLVLFPDNVKFKGIRYEAFKDLSRYLAQHPIGTLRPALENLISESGREDSISTELVPGSGEPITIELIQEPSAVLVCIHGSRDCRCGDQGGEFYQILKDMVGYTGLTNSIKVYGVSHIGGHKWAPNTIMYPSGDWHGNLSEKDSVDAQQILFDALANGGIAAGVRERGASDPIMIDKWRGRMGLSQEDQQKLYQRVLEKQKQKQTIAPNQVEAQSMFSSPGEDLYQEDGLKEQRTAASDEANKPQSKQASAEGDEAPRVKIVFETYQKVRTEIDAKVGERILDIVKDKDPSRSGVYQALECTCGGQLECATCHVYIEPPFYARLPGVTDAEEDMLEYAVGRKESSRLGCQIKIKPEMEGMVVKLPQY